VKQDDPDLFAFRPGAPADRFFVEVKHHDQITEKQRVAFPLIEQLCPVIVARLVPTDPARRKTGASAASLRSAALAAEPQAVRRLEQSRAFSDSIVRRRR
jgi:hypothetical protein